MFGGCFYEFDIVANCSVLGICRAFLINQKHNVGWVLPKVLVDLCRECSLRIETIAIRFS